MHALRLLITGSEGSLAQIVIPYLLREGHQIVGVDNFARYGHIDRPRPYQLIEGDLADTTVVRSLFGDQRFDAVFHFAALVYGVVGFHKKPADIIADNSLLTMNLLKYGREATGRFIYLSSSMVYEQSDKLPHGEEDTETTRVMRTSYGLSKYIGERAVTAFHEQYAIDHVIWRPFNIITPFETAEEEGFSHVFSDLVEKILVQRQQPLEILGDGHQVRCFTNIYDVADAIAQFSLDPKARNETFNIGQKIPLTVRELASEVRAIGVALGVLPGAYQLTFRENPIYADDVKKRIPDTSKIEQVFGWKARITPQESLEAYVRRKFGLPVTEAGTTH